MQAIRCQPAGRTRSPFLRDPLTIRRPAADEAVIRIEAIGVNYIDTYQRSGLYPARSAVHPCGMERCRRRRIRRILASAAFRLATGSRTRCSWVPTPDLQAVPVAQVGQAGAGRH